MPLHLEMKVGETVELDDGRVRLTLEEKKGQRARLRVDGDSSVSIGTPEKAAASPALTQPPTKKQSPGSQE